MRSPQNVLESLKSKACNKEYSFQRLYRNLYNPELYYLAYQNIYAKEGNMTEGSDSKTIDGMSAKRIDRLIASLKDHSYHPNPARRTYIQKKNNPQKKRPLGIPSFDDKLLQEVVRMILESIYEGSFSRHSHGFRPSHSCHTALMEVKHKFIGTKWFIEGDIKGCFDNVDHAVLINLLRRRIKDEYFISLIWKFLKAGYMEDWVYHNTYSGTPQGSIISPILANIYLHELDCYMEQLSENFHCGKVRRRTSEYQKQVSRMQYLHDRKYGKDTSPCSLIQRLKARKCEWCEAENVDLEVHHIRRLKDLKGKALWERAMIGRRHKTMVLCTACHDLLHAGKLD